MLLQAEASLAQVQAQARVMGTELELHAGFYHSILYTRFGFRKLLSHNSYKVEEASRVRVLMLGRKDQMEPATFIEQRSGF